MRVLARRAMIVAAFLTGAWDATARQAGEVQGLVVDEAGEPVDGATVVVASFGDTSRIERPTSTDGRYRATDLTPGLYTVTGAKGPLGGDMFRIRIRSGEVVEVDLTLTPGRRIAAWMTEASDREALARAFATGVRAQRDGRTADAIAAFGEALEINASCLECAYNLAIAYTEADRLADAEEAFKQVLDIQPDYAAAYYGLSNLYLRDNRPGDAAAARAEATRIALDRLARGRARALDAVDRGRTFLDAGNVSDARDRFETAVALDATHGAAHYWLGVSLAALGNAAPAQTALRRYLALEPEGDFSADARARLATLER